ncbi:MAG: C-GCAxxG-C-C family protein [Candidatus Limivivens sp.]|nr:C-GCAxxG-C-C family protein [Candidatus Limivivens sp.]
MTERVQKALENHKKGMNCAQAVACAFADAVGVDETLLFRAAEGFGAGMGDMRGTCGAVSGAILLAGLKNSSGTPANPTKGATYQLSKEITGAFEKMNGSTICRELKGVETKKVLRSCDGCIEDAAKIAEAILGL